MNSEDTYVANVTGSLTIGSSVTLSITHLGAAWPTRCSSSTAQLPLAASATCKVTIRAPTWWTTRPPLTIDLGCRARRCTGRLAGRWAARNMGHDEPELAEFTDRYDGHDLDQRGHRHLRERQRRHVARPPRSAVSRPPPPGCSFCAILRSPSTSTWSLGTAEMITAAAGTTVTITASVSGSGDLTTQGLGTTVLTQANPFTGSLTAAQGFLQVYYLNGSNGTGTITLGSPSTLGTLQYVGTGSASTNRGLDVLVGGGEFDDLGGALPLTAGGTRYSPAAI